MVGVDDDGIIEVRGEAPRHRVAVGQGGDVKSLGYQRAGAFAATALIGFDQQDTNPRFLPVTHDGRFCREGEIVKAAGQSPGGEHLRRSRPITHTGIVDRKSHPAM